MGTVVSSVTYLTHSNELVAINLSLHTFQITFTTTKTIVGIGAYFQDLDLHQSMVISPGQVKAL